MSECTDRRFENMLYAYELDLLDDDECHQLEVHLLECDACFVRAQELEAAARLIVHDRDVQDSVYADAVETAILPRWRLPGLLSRRLVPAAAIVVAAVVIFLLVPWHIEMEPSHEAVADISRLAIMPFANLADPADSAKLGDIAANLLSADLTESRYITVISPQRLNEEYARLGIDDERGINQDMALRVAKATGAAWVITGSIIQARPTLMVLAQLINVRSGEVAASRQIAGKPGDDIFGLVDTLTREIRQDLTLPASASLEPDPRVADITTHSPQAYFCFLDGVENISRLYIREALASFEEAVVHDSTFAMAYYYLAKFKDPALIEQALKYADRAGRREQLYIKGLAARLSGKNDTYAGILQDILAQYPEDRETLFSLGAYAKGELKYLAALEYMNRAIEVDPHYKEPYNELAYIYDALGDFDNAIWAINTYIQLAPEEANPYDTRGDLYANNGKPDKAIASYKKALELKADYNPSLTKLGNVYLFLRDYAKAEECYRKMLTFEDPTIRAGARIDLANIPTMLGKFREALETLDNGIALNRLEMSGQQLAFYESISRRKKISILIEMGDIGRALEEINAVIGADGLAITSLDPKEQPIFIHFLAQCGDLDRAHRLTEVMRDTLQARGASMYEYLQAAGAVALEEGDAAAAAEHLEKADEVNPWRIAFTLRFLLARAYQESGSTGDAVAEWERQLNIYSSDRLCSTVNSIKVHYYLGLAYEASQWFGKAARQYEIFLDIWGNSDADLASVADARARLARLQSET